MELLSKFRQSDSLRFYKDDSTGKEYVNMMDLAKILLLPKNTNDVLNRVWAEYRFKLAVGVGQPGWWVNEYGVHQMIFSSQHPQAVEIQKWVFEDVLPKLRARGGYLMPSATSEQIEALKAEHQALQKENLQLNQRVEDLEVSQNELIEASYSVFLLVMKIAPVLIEWSIDLIPSIRRGFEVKGTKAYFQSITFRMTSGLQKLVDIDDYVRKLERLNFDRWDLQAETPQEKKSVFDSFLTQLAKLQR
jgi:prophage antirepressor-like protein